MISELFDVFLFDLDGTIYLGDQPIHGAPDAIKRLREMGKTIRFLTNDPRPTRKKIVDRLNKMQITSYIKEIVTAGWTTAAYLRENNIRSAYVVGSKELKSELAHLGIKVIDKGSCEAVVVGCDEHVSYHDIQQATKHIFQGAKFIATNADPSFPTPEGPYPATGAIVKAIEVSTDIHPTIIGKPYSPMFLMAIQSLDKKLRMVVIGDNPSTDILGAHQIGIAGILVSKKKVVFPSAHDFRIPDAVIPDLSSIFNSTIILRHRKNPSFSWPDQVKAGVAGVILNGADKVLLIKRADNGLWGLPTGHVKPGETVKVSMAT
jgi:HAD superfamily hydrolase (TIGR01450 family)